jgi:hypothetical protein
MARYSGKRLILLALLAILALYAAAQEEDRTDDIFIETEEEAGPDVIEEEVIDDEEDVNSGLPISTDWAGLSLTGYTRGDQTFNISLGILIPLFFTDLSGNAIPNKVMLGGAGALAYTYFLDSYWFVGGILEGSFSQTLGENFLYLIPIGFTLGYQIIYKRFEFPFSITAGGMTEQYLTYSLWGPFVKPQASAFFRYNSDWSFGLNAAWWLVPQVTNTRERDSTGNFFEITLCARYHF